MTRKRCSSSSKGFHFNSPSFERPGSGVATARQTQLPWIFVLKYNTRCCSYHDGDQYEVVKRFPVDNGNATTPGTIWNQWWLPHWDHRRTSGGSLGWGNKGLCWPSRHASRYASRHASRYASRHASWYASRHGSRHASQHGLPFFVVSPYPQCPLSFCRRSHYFTDSLLETMFTLSTFHPLM